MVEKPIHEGFEHIIDEKHQLEDLINMDDLKKVLEDFHKIAPFPVAILNLKGEVLLKSHWEPICTQFHRVNPKTAAICTESDTHFNTELVRGDERYILYKCENGLYDAASPITIEGQHLGNFFIGQFLLERPAEGFFRKQAQRYGFEEEGYLEALSRVAIISEHDLKNRLDYFCGFAEVLGNIGLKEFQRDRAEEALRESHKALAESQRIANLGSWELDLNTQIITLSKEHQFMAERDPKQIALPLAEYAADYIVEEDIDIIQDRLGLAVKNIENSSYHDTFEYRLKTDDVGGYKNFAVKGRFKSKGIVYGVTQDITRQRQDEDVLRESELKFHSLFDFSPQAIVLIDVKTDRIFDVNDMFCELTKYSKKEILDLSIIEVGFYSEEDRNRFIEELKVSGEVHGLEMNFRIKDGSILNTLTFARIVQIAGKSFIMTIFLNITDQKRLEAQLRQSQKMKAVGTLAGGIAHDFNNLLMAIQGHASIILMNKDSSHPDFDHLREIEDNVERAADLTKQLLGFARGGKYEITPTDLNELIKKENRMFGRTRKEISIRGKYEKDLWSVDIDRGQIGQVLLNLYINAWQAMPAGGDLYIKTQNVTLGENLTKPYQVEPGRYVQISVTDTGVGMDKATRERIFEPFFTTKEIGRGTGMGLPSGYGIIKNHGGFINVYSEKGHGTTFNIYMPASEKEVIEEKKPVVNILRGSETVLFVDDENMIIEVTKEVLEHLDYKVLIARSGKEAIETYEKNKERIDIVLLDMIMPDMSGGDTYDRMKDIDPNVKVILSSGYSINGQATEIMDRGCDGFIQKPFKMKELSQKLREILDEK